MKRVHNMLHRTASLFCFGSLLLALPVAAVDKLSEDELQEAYRQAAEAFDAVPVEESAFLAEEGPDASESMADAPESVADGSATVPDIPEAQKQLDTVQSSDKQLDVALVSPDAKAFFTQNKGSTYLPLRDIALAVDVQNTTLDSLVKQIVTMAEKRSGPWQVSWRLKPENRYILEEKVNVTAETSFGDFMDFLVERVNNMTGVQLNVRVFNVSRIIVISDSYGY